MAELLFLKPVFKEVIWGGDALRTRFGYDIPSSHTGECWAVSGHKNGDCRIRGGAWDGCTLGQLWREHRELFGGAKGDQFPILVKIIDARQDLSIQVHPDDAYAREHENGSLGKTECWYILDCEPGTEIIIGHNASTKEELKQMIEEGRWQELLRTYPIRRGDFFQIEPGTLHAIKGGTLLIETQQSSDVTYRVYDYGRLQDGKPRPLHLAQSLEVINCPDRTPHLNRQEEKTEGYCLEKLAEGPYYCVEHLQLSGEMRRETPAQYEIAGVLDGEGTIDGVRVKKGDFFLIPYGYGDYVLKGQMEMLLARP